MEYADMVTWFVGHTNFGGKLQQLSFYIKTIVTVDMYIKDTHS